MVVVGYFNVFGARPVSVPKSLGAVPHLEQVCKEVGFNTSHGLAYQVINDLKHGADIGARGRSRLPSKGPNSKSTTEHGVRIQDTLAAFIAMGVYTGPLSLEEAETLGYKIHPIQIKLKEDGSVRVCTNASHPLVEDLASEGDEVPASLNAFIDLNDFPAKMDGLPVLLRSCGAKAGVL